jgi:hypothetical protein
MARGRRKEYSRDAEPLDPKQRTLPAVCPLCEMSVPREMLTHLESHAPVEVCTRCDGKEREWRLDTDGANHFRADVSIFFCSHCGRYALLPVREEVGEADPPS